MSSQSKIVLSNYMEVQGLVVEGNETLAELREAYGYLRQVGRPAIIRAER